MKKPLIILLLTLLLILLGVGGWWMFAEKSAPHSSGRGLGSLFQSQPPSASFIEVKDLIITLQGEDGRARYLLLDLVLVVRGEEQAAQAQAFEPAVRGATVELLNNQPYNEVRARKVTELHDQLLKRYQDECLRLGLAKLPFDDVMISKMVFQ